MDDVALPVVEQYPNDAWQLVLGYDQEKLMGVSAGAAVVRSVREAEQSASSAFNAGKETQKSRLCEAALCVADSSFHRKSSRGVLP
jgi:hypothetical protein